MKTGFSIVDDRPLTAVMEDYLEAILELKRGDGVVRVRDLAKKMRVKMPSVTHMLKALGERGVVHYEPYGYVELTAEGQRIGGETLRRHSIIRSFLSEVLQVSPDAAEMDACKIEHALSDETLASLVVFIDFVQNCPLAGKEWLAHFREYKKGRRSRSACQANLQRVIDHLQKHLMQEECKLPDAGKGRENG